MNLRLTCRDLSSHPALATALLHTLHVFPTDESYQRLLAIARNPHLATHIQTIVAHRPIFGYGTTSWRDCDAMLTDRFRCEKRAALAGTGLSYHEISGCVKLLIKEHFHWTKPQMKAGWESLRDQTDHMQKRTVQLMWSYAFQRFVNVRKVHLCSLTSQNYFSEPRANRNYDLSFPVREQYISRLYPSALITDVPITTLDHNWNGLGIYPLVTGASWVSGLAIEEWLIGEDLEAVDFKGEAIDVCPFARSVIFPSFAPGHRALSSDLHDLMGLRTDFPELKELRLANTLDAFCSSSSSLVSHFKGMIQLKTLHLEDIHFGQHNISILLSNTKQLRMLTLKYVSFEKEELDGRLWFEVFNMLRRRANVNAHFDSLEIYKPPDQAYDQVTFLNGQQGARVDADLKGFIEGQTLRTTALEEHFKTKDPSS